MAVDATTMAQAGEGGSNRIITVNQREVDRQVIHCDAMQHIARHVGQENLPPVAVSEQDKEETSGRTCESTAARQACAAHWAERVPRIACS